MAGVLGEIAPSDVCEGAEGAGDLLGGGWESAEFVAAGEEQEPGWGGDEGDGDLEFFGGTEGIAEAVDEEGGCMEAGEVGCAELVGLSWRVEGVGEEQEGGGNAGLFAGEEGCLAAAVGVAAEEDAAGEAAGERVDGGEQAGAVAGCGAGRWRTGGPRLAEGEIASERGNAGGGEGLGCGDEEWRAAIGAGAMGEDEAVGTGTGMEKPEHVGGLELDRGPRLLPTRMRMLHISSLQGRRERVQ